MSASEKKLAQFRSTPEELAEIDQAILDIVAEERATISSTLRLSIRHIYYRVEMMGLVPKTDEADRDKEWNHPGQWTPAGSRIVGRRINEMRDDGRLAWDAIGDGTRRRESTGGHIHTHIGDALNSVRFMLDEWEDQPRYVELWLGKAAMEGAVEDLARNWWVGITCTKGFTSWSILRDAAREIAQYHAGRPVHIGWLDDCDPSAELTFQKIQQFLRKHAPEVKPHLWHFHKIAVTREQRDMSAEDRGYGLQTRDTKDTTHGNAADFGDSVEVDAVPTVELRQMVSDWLEGVIDHDAWEATGEREREGQEIIDEAITELRERWQDEGLIP